MLVADWLAVYAQRMLLVKDVNEMALWSYHGARTQNGVKFADVGLLIDFIRTGKKMCIDLKPISSV